MLYCRQKGTFVHICYNPRILGSELQIDFEIPPLHDSASDK